MESNGQGVPHLYHWNELRLIQINYHCSIPTKLLLQEIDMKTTCKSNFCVWILVTWWEQKKISISHYKGLVWAFHFSKLATNFFVFMSREIFNKKLEASLCILVKPLTMGFYRLKPTLGSALHGPLFQLSPERLGFTLHVFPLPWAREVQFTRHNLLLFWDENSIPWEMRYVVSTITARCTLPFGRRPQAVAPPPLDVVRKTGRLCESRPHEPTLRQADHRCHHHVGPHRALLCSVLSLSLSLL